MSRHDARVPGIAGAVLAIFFTPSVATGACVPAVFRVSADIPITQVATTALDHQVLRLEGGAATLEDYPGIPEIADLDGFARRANGSLLMSFDTTVTIAGQLVRPGDVVEFDPVLNTWNVVYDSRAAGLPDGVNTDAVALTADERLVLSFDRTFGLGPSLYRAADLVELNGSQFVGKVLDAAAAGLPPNADIDAAAFDSARNLVVSFVQPGSDARVAWSDDDLVVRQGTTWAIYFRPSSQDDGWQVADLDALDIVGIGDGLFCNGYE